MGTLRALAGGQFSGWGGAGAGQADDGLTCHLAPDTASEASEDLCLWLLKEAVPTEVGAVASPPEKQDRLPEKQISQLGAQPGLEAQAARALILQSTGSSAGCRGGAARPNYTLLRQAVSKD